MRLPKLFWRKSDGCESMARPNVCQSQRTSDKTTKEELKSLSRLSQTRAVCGDSFFFVHLKPASPQVTGRKKECYLCLEHNLTVLIQVPRNLFYNQQQNLDFLFLLKKLHAHIRACAHTHTDTNTQTQNRNRFDAALMQTICSLLIRHCTKCLLTLFFSPLLL